MTTLDPLILSEAVLTIHLVVIAFNLFGLVAIPLGGGLGWRYVRLFWWRALHLASLAVVAIQALAGQACFLTVMQDTLSGARPAPLIMSWINKLLFWPLPMWVFCDAVRDRLSLYAGAVAPHTAQAVDAHPPVKR